MNYEKMTSAEFYLECADVVARLATQVMTIARDTAALTRHDPDEAVARPLLEFSMLSMVETLGNLLNNMDAVQHDDSWTDGVLAELQRRFPQRAGVAQVPPPSASDGEAC